MTMLDRIKEHVLSIRPTFRYCCRYGLVEEVRKYLEEGADCTARDNYGIRVASLNGHLEVVRFLKEAQSKTLILTKK